MVVGTFILLVSFFSQRFLVNRFENNLKQVSEATEIYSRVHLSSLQYLNLYFASRSAGADDAPQILRKAATENSIGNLAFIISTPLESQERQEWIDRLSDAAFAVKDLDTYNAYVAFLNTMEHKLYPMRTA